MKKHIEILIGFTLLFSSMLMGCYSDTKNEYISNEREVLDDKSYLELDTAIFPVVYSDEGIEIQLPGIFRAQRPVDFEDLKTGSWYEFLQNPTTKEFYLIEANPIVGKGFDACIGDSATYVDSGSKIKPIFFIKGLNEPVDKLNSVKLTQNMVWSGNRMLFVFNKQEYILEGEGHVLAENEPLVDRQGLLGKQEKVINYKLYLTSKVDGDFHKQLLVAIPAFNKTNVKILFIGDIDNDRKPDFVFDVSRDVEEKSVVLMLSTKADSSEIVRCVGQSSYQFNCL